MCNVQCLQCLNVDNVDTSKAQHVTQQLCFSPTTTWVMPMASQACCCQSLPQVNA